MTFFFIPAHVSVTTTLSSDASTDEFNVFDEDNYTVYGDDDNVTSVGITFTQTNGRFTVTDAGKYLITMTWIIQLEEATTYSHDCILKLNGTQFYNHNIQVLNTADPVSHTISIIKDMSASQYITAHQKHSHASNTSRSIDGTTMTIHRIA